MLNISLNEIYSEAYKAFRSIGIEWGLAKDAANQSKWLAEHGFYFLGSILKNADLYKKGELSLLIKENTLEKPLSAALTGLLLVEYVSSANLKWKGYIYDYKFLCAAMGIIGNEQNVQLILKKNKKIIACTLGKKIYVQKDMVNKTEHFSLEPYLSNQEFDLNKLQKIEKLPAPKVNKKCWDRLKLMAFETYVPESETSKSGAGY